MSDHPIDWQLAEPSLGDTVCGLFYVTLPLFNFRYFKTLHGVVDLSSPFITLFLHIIEVITHSHQILGLNISI